MPDEGQQPDPFADLPQPPAEFMSVFRGQQPGEEQDTQQWQPQQAEGEYSYVAPEDAQEYIPTETAPEEKHKPEFNPKYREAFFGLLHLGALSRQVTFWGHTFVLRTLTQDELFTVPLLTKEWQDTMILGPVQNAAIVALAIDSVDGKSLPTSYEKNGSVSQAAQRFEYVRKNWYSAVINRLYNEYLLLEREVREVLEEMGNRSG